MQVIENLLVVHNIDEQNSQAYDLKLGTTDYNDPLLIDETIVNLDKTHLYVTDLIREEEKLTGDDGYQIVEPF